MGGMLTFYLSAHELDTGLIVESRGDDSLTGCNRGVAAAVLLQFQPCGCVDGTSNSRSEAKFRVCWVHQRVHIRLTDDIASDGQFARFLPLGFLFSHIERIT